MPETAENWYAEPFSKHNGCQTSGQCGDGGNCDCNHSAMADVEQLPLIEEIAAMFPNEWLTFIVPPAEDDDPSPTHGKLVAHSPDPDKVFDAMTAVLWNQCLYTYFNGNYEALQASYGEKISDLENR